MCIVRDQNRNRLSGQVIEQELNDWLARYVVPDPAHANDEETVSQSSASAALSLDPNLDGRRTESRLRIAFSRELYGVELTHRVALPRRCLQ